MAFTILQGEFCTRHVAPKPDGSGAYSPHDLLPGAVIVVRSREFTVLDADPVTRQRAAERYVGSLSVYIKTLSKDVVVGVAAARVQLWRTHWPGIERHHPTIQRLLLLVRCNGGRRGWHA